MASNKVTVIYPAEELMNGVTMTVVIKESKQFKFRRWLATQLIILSAKILGCGIEIK